MDQTRDAAVTKIIEEKCGGGGAIDVVVAKNCDCFAPLDGRRNSLGCGAHVFELIRIGQKVSQGRVQIILRHVRCDAASRQNPRQEIAGAVELRDGKGLRFAGNIEPVPPRATARRALDSKNRAAGAGWKGITHARC